jgi:hypothetical protein
MEYDTSTVKADPVAHEAKQEKNNVQANRGHVRAQSKPVDVSILNEPVTFAFSDRTAKNRFLKAPMTERLCYWNKEGEDIVWAHPISSLSHSSGSTQAFRPFFPPLPLSLNCLFSSLLVWYRSHY